METQFIQMAYKQHHVMPATKTLSYLIYKISEALQQRVIALANTFGFRCEASEGKLIVSF